MSWSHLTRIKQRLLKLETMSELKDAVMSLDKCRLRRVMLTLIDMFEYESERRMNSSSINSWCDFHDAVEEKLRSEREDVIEIFVDASRDESSLVIIDAWTDEWRVEVLDKMNDVASVRSSPCKDTSNNNESELVKSKEAESFEKIEKLSITLSDNCSWISVKRRSVDN